MKSGLTIVLLFGAAAIGIAASRHAEQAKPEGTPPLQKYRVSPTELPSPTTGTANPPQVVDRPAGAELHLPPGFKIDQFADEGQFKTLRYIIEGPNGEVFAADVTANTIVSLSDTNGDGKADERHVFADGLNRPFGMAIGDGYFYVGNTDSVVRWKYTAGLKHVEGAPEKIAALPGGGGHSTRTLMFNADATKLYVSIGSASNVDAEGPPRASILEMNPDGSGLRVFASGIRNGVGLAIQPGTNLLWTAVNERDMLGDDLVSDYVTHVQDGGFYGWPYSYLGQHEDPRRKGERPDLVAKAIVPDVLLQSHSAPLGIAFYTGSAFPADYKGDAFVALHGSWNRKLRTGYKVIRVTFKDGKPTGDYEDFITGWSLGEGQSQVWGRPVSIAVHRDGSLLVSDDAHNLIWRVTYAGTGSGN
jgi:glucose/arabinose dehydrogenase